MKIYENNRAEILALLFLYTYINIGKINVSSEGCEDNFFK